MSQGTNKPRLAIQHKELLINCKYDMPPLNELVVGYQVFTPVFAMLLDINEEPEWFKVEFIHSGNTTEVVLTAFEDDEPPITHWCRIATVVTTTSN